MLISLGHRKSRNFDLAGADLAWEKQDHRDQGMRDSDFQVVPLTRSEPFQLDVGEAPLDPV